MAAVNELIVDAYGCAGPLSDVKQLEREARKAVEKVGAKVASVDYHLFQPHGLTLCLILKESHCIISTWPEYNLAITNIFLCNASMDPRDCWDSLSQFLQPSKVTFHDVKHKIESMKKKAA